MNITHECPACGFEDDEYPLSALFSGIFPECPECGYAGPDDEEHVNEFLKTLDNSNEA
jgi:Zn ribbon nucleic-acid-binding protein